MKTTTPLDAETVAQLANGFRGTLIQPGDSGYDDARMVRNGLIDRSPAIIARAHGTADVVVELASQDRDIVYASLQDQWQVANDWNLTVGLRYDDYSDFGSTVNPRAALVWDASTDMTAKLLYGRAFRAPSFTELFVRNNPVALGNPDLDPEVSNTWELAFDYRASFDLRLGLNVFMYDIEDLIEFVPTGPGTQVARNIGEQKGHGFEVEAEWKPVQTLRLVANPQLPAIPLLTIAGYVLAAGRSSHRLVRAYKSVLGWIPGGMAVMVVIVCAVFTTFTGASGVTILALGGLVYPMLVRDGYPKGFSLGMVTAAGSLGLLFPPSLPVILYSVAASSPGSVAPVAVDQLFIGGFLPGLSLVLLVSLYGMYQGHKAGAPRQKLEWNEARAAMWEAKWDIVVPVVVMGSFLSGIATIVESAAIGAAYALVIELTVFRNMKPTKDLPAALLNAASLVGAVVVLLGVALGLTNYLVEAEVPTKLVEWVQAHIHSRWVFLLVLNIGLLILGSVLEIYSAIVVLVPLVAPLGVAFEVNPVHLGVIFLANLELGFLCPPMGLNLFLSATRFQKPLPYLYREALPFLAIMTVGVLFITYVPGVTLWLLHALGKG